MRKTIGHFRAPTILKNTPERHADMPSSHEGYRLQRVSVGYARLSQGLVVHPGKMHTLHRLLSFFRLPCKPDLPGSLGHEACNPAIHDLLL